MMWPRSRPGLEPSTSPDLGEEGKEEEQPLTREEEKAETFGGRWYPADGRVSDEARRRKISGKEQLLLP